jgi:hypothetical protein
MKRRRRPEQELQTAVCEQIRLRRVDGLIFWHTPNAGKRSIQAGRRLKAQGMTAGVLDLILVHVPRRQNYALELKATKKGRPSPEQKQMMIDLEEAGWEVACERGIDAAIKRLQNWELIR